MKSIRLALALALAATLLAPPAAAIDPVALIVLRMLRDHIITSQLEAALARAQQPAPAAPVRQYPGDVRTLVDEGFPYLDAAQRSAIHAGLMDVMSDSRHAGQRDAILAQFIETANASREAHQALSRLTADEKRTIAVRAADTLRGRSADERQELIDALRSPAVPIPSDLRALMLAELGAPASSAIPR